MMGHDGVCEICGGHSDEDDVLDGPEPADKLCPACRKVVKLAREAKEQRTTKCPNDPTHLIRVEYNGRGRTVVCLICKTRHRSDAPPKQA